MSNQPWRYPNGPQQALERRARASLGVGDHPAGGRTWDVPALASAAWAAPVTGYFESLWAQEERLGRKVVRPELVTNPRHDTCGYDPQDELDQTARIRSTLGSEHFTAPEAGAGAPEDDGRLHLLGELAKVLRIKPDTARHWERSGILPRADHYSAGSGKARKRMYTSAQVTGLAEIYQSEGVHHNNINSTRFSERAHALFAELASSPAPAEADHG
ncbi:MAG: MerR family transcriptional regulator [Streptosporangiaceae bacterium]